jgi:hypothetical protein
MLTSHVLLMLQSHDIISDDNNINFIIPENLSHSKYPSKLWTLIASAIIGVFNAIIAAIMR